MAIFKKKTKAEKEDRAAEKAAKKTDKKQDKKAKKANGQTQPTEPKPAHQPYQPRHAASDAVPKIQAPNGPYLSQDAANYAQSSANSKNPSAAQNEGPAWAQDIRANGMGPPHPYRGLNSTLGTMQRNNSAEVFTTDPDAPPMPTASPMLQNQGSTPREGLSSNNSTYFSHATAPASTFDSDALRNPKMAVAAKDHGGMNPHLSADSGYGSTSHSRAPSENWNPQDPNKPHLPRDDSGFLPELSLSEELAREPAFSEASFEDTDRPLTSQTQSMQKQPESAPKNGKGYFSHLDPMNDARSVKSAKSTKSTQKQTRFDVQTPAKPQQAQQTPRTQPSQQSSQQQIEQQNFLPEPVRDERPESATMPQQYSQPATNPAPEPVVYEASRPSFAVPERSTTPTPQRQYQEPQPPYSMPARTSTPPPAREREQVAAPVRYSSPPPQTYYSPLERIMSHGAGSIISRSRAGSMSVSGVLSGLEGYKVNKRGKILDEEGDVVGELVEGDIMDCVRQRCNAYGEVLDDRGRVVGRVQAIEGSMESPVMRIASPTPMTLQQQQYQHHYQQAPMASQEGSHRRQSNVSQPEVFTPAWQRQSQNAQPSLARELQDHLAAVEFVEQQPVAPLDYPRGGVTAVELDTVEATREPGEEVMPLFDHTEVFMPPPFVPARSPRRSETPSPPNERSQVQTLTQQQSAKHLSLPVAPRSYEQPEREIEARQYPTATARAQTSALSPRQYQQRPQSEEVRSMHLPVQAAAAASTPAPASRTEPQYQSQEQLAYAQPAQQQEQPQQQPQRQVQRVSSAPLQRSASETSMSDLAKSYSRPSMSPVPEDEQAGPGPTPSPAAFSYRGDIPANDGPVSNSRLAPNRAMGAKSPPLPSFPRQAFTGGLAAGTAFAPMNAAAFSPAGGVNRPMPPRTFTTGVPGPRPILQGRQSLNMPLKRSPLSSHETTPPDSDQGSYEDEKLVRPNDMHSRQPSANTMTPSVYSQATPTAMSNTKSRTYFTHGGRVTVGPQDSSPAQAAAKAAARIEPEPAPSVKSESKRSRFSFLGKKK